MRLASLGSAARGKWTGPRRYIFSNLGARLYISKGRALEIPGNNNVTPTLRGVMASAKTKDDLQTAMRTLEADGGPQFRQVSAAIIIALAMHACWRTPSWLDLNISIFFFDVQ